MSRLTYMEEVFIFRDGVLVYGVIGGTRRRGTRNGLGWGLRDYANDKIRRWELHFEAKGHVNAGVGFPTVGREFPPRQGPPPAAFTSLQPTTRRPINHMTPCTYLHNHRRVRNSIVSKALKTP